MILYFKVIFQNKNYFISGPPSFTNPQQHGFGGGAANMSTVTTNSFAGDLVQSSHKGMRPPSALGGATSHGGSVQQQQQQPGGCVPPGPPSQNGLPSADLCYNGTELVVLYDYKASDILKFINGA